MTTDILLHSEHAGGCASGFITKGRESNENWEGISKGRKKYNKIRAYENNRVRKLINQAKKLKNKSR
jgi:hypothetical protein